MYGHCLAILWKWIVNFYTCFNDWPMIKEPVHPILVSSLVNDVAFTNENIKWVFTVGMKALALPIGEEVLLPSLSGRNSYLADDGSIQHDSKLPGCFQFNVCELFGRFIVYTIQEDCQTLICLEELIAAIDIFWYRIEIFHVLVIHPIVDHGAHLYLTYFLS